MEKLLTVTLQWKDFKTAPDKISMGHKEEGERTG